MKQILVTLDFSDNSARALDAAKVIAAKTGAKLILLHVYQPDITDVSIPALPNSAPIFEAIENTHREHLQEYIVAARAEGFETEGVWATGGIVPAILDQARQLGADLIVVGRTGKGGFFDKLIGSSATGIAVGATCPVLVIPPQASVDSFKEIVYATQLEHEETHILSEVQQLTEVLGSRLRFVKVSSLEQPNIQPDGQMIDELTRSLDITEDDIEIISGGGVMEGIEKYCQEVNADMLIVSTRDRGFLEQFIINPSITRKLVVETHIPLLVYHIR